jgi:RNase P/RNase MRP subunit POP5
MRRKSRYVLIESSSDLGMSVKENAVSFMESMRDALGEAGYLKASPKIIKAVGERMFIVRVNRGAERDTVLASAFIKRAGGAYMGFRTLGISGTIKALMRRAAQ